MAAKRKATPKAGNSKKMSKNSSSGKSTRSMKMEVMDNNESMSQSFDSTKVKAVSTKTKAALLIAFIVIVFALYKGKGYFVAAMVNNQPITRLSVVSELEKRSGKQALDSLITQALIKQEAKSKGVTVSSDEVNAEVKKVEDSVKAQNQDLDNLLSLQGMTRSDLYDQLETQKLVEKIFGSDIEPTDAEITDYISKNKDSFPAGTSDEDKKSQTKDVLRQQKLSDKFQTWISDVKAKANIKYYVNY